MDVDASGAATVGGSSVSGDFPTTFGAFSTFFNGGQFGGDGFVARLDPTGASLVWSTYLGGLEEDAVLDLACEPGGSVVACGVTTSFDFPISPGALDPQLTGLSDGFVARLAPDGTAVPAATFLGGGAGETLSALVLDSSGDVVVVGSTESSNFPATAGVPDATFAGVTEGVVARLAPGLDALVFSTFLGGALHDRVEAVALEAAGTLVVGGSTGSKDFPTTPGAYDRTFNESLPPLGFDDAFAARLAGDGSALEYSTYIGHHDNDEILALAAHPSGAAVLAGRTSSFHFPTTAGVIDNFYGFSADGKGFVTLFDMLVGPIPYGAGKQTSQGNAGTLSASGFPSVADQDFSLDAQAIGLAFRPGVLFRGSGPAALPFQGAVLHVAPPVRRVAPFTFDFIGWAGVPFALDPAMIGTTLYFQAWFLDPADPQKFGLTNALQVLVHP